MSRLMQSPAAFPAITTLADFIDNSMPELVWRYMVFWQKFICQRSMADTQSWPIPRLSRVGDGSGRTRASASRAVDEALTFSSLQRTIPSSTHATLSRKRSCSSTMDSEARLGSGDSEIKFCAFAKGQRLPARSPSFSGMLVTRCSRGRTPSGKKDDTARQIPEVLCTGGRLTLTVRGVRAALFAPLFLC